MERWLHFGGKYDLRVRLEFKAADCWIGVFAKRDLLHRAKFYDVWICVVPMFPIHLAWDIEAPPGRTAHNEVRP